MKEEAAVTVLVEGKLGKKSWSTVTLIKDDEKFILADPGTCKPKKLLAVLEKEGLSSEDISVVALTHPHLDHTRNLSLFPKAEVLDYWGVWKDQELELHREEWSYSPNIKVIYTPGHCEESITLLVTTPKGKVAVCGDVFFHEGGPENDVYANNPRLLAKTREELLKKADIIVPGHGKAFSKAP